MVKRYLGGVMSANQIKPNSQVASGIFNPADQLILKNKNLWELTPSWDLFRARYASTGKLGQYNVTAQEGSPTAFFFRSDGTRLYVMGDTGDDVNQYELGTAWDVTTATYTKVFSISAQETAANALFFSPDGTKMYVMGSAGDDVNEYTLSTAWDVGTAVYVQVFSIAAQETTPWGLFFRADGLKMYVIGTASDRVHEYTLGTAWNVSTAVFTNSSVNIAAQDTTSTGVTFKPDGTRMYIVGTSNDSIHEYSLTTAWNITTAALVRSFVLNFSGVFGASAPADLYFNDTGTAVWIFSGTVIQQYNLSIAWNVSTITLQTPTAYFNVAFEETGPSAIAFKPDGTKMYVLGQTGDDVNEYTLSVPWDITSAVYTQLFSVVGQEIGPSAIAFKPDGTKMYVIGQIGNDINEYSLSTAWNIGTAVYQGVTAPVRRLGQYSEITPTGLFFKPDGTEFYTVGTDLDRVQTFLMSTPWTLSTLRIKTPLNCLNISQQDISAEGIYFRPDGLKMYMIGLHTDSVYEYTLSAAWDIYNAAYVRSFSVAAQEATPYGVFFKPDGLKMYVTGDTGDDVNEYNLSTAWDISTAVYSSIFSIVGQAGSVSGIFFKSDGLKMYIVSDGTQNSVFEYTLSTAWTVTSAVYSNRSVSVVTTAQDVGPVGLFFKPDGTRLYVIGNAGTKIYEYVLSDAWNTSTATYVRASTLLGVGAVASLQFSADGTRVFFIDTDMNVLVSYDLTVAWDISTVVIAMNGNYGNYTVTTQDTAPAELFFKSDGTKMYVLSNTNDNVYEYVLTTAWDVTTAALSSTFYVGAQDTVPTGLFFKPDGNTMYIVGDDSNSVYAYDLSYIQ